jgi:hypothetical protein
MDLRAAFGRTSKVRLLAQRARRVCVPLGAVCLLTFLTGSAVASTPWDLHCPAMPAEHAAPAPVTAAARTFFPWVKTAGDALHDGPVYLVALSSHTQISRDGDYRDGDDYYLHRALIAVAPAYRGAVAIAGARLGTRGARTTLGFSTDGANHCTVSNPVVNCGNRSLRYASQLRIPADRGWRIVETELRIGRTGCFRITATGAGLKARIPLAVPGPDWGTPGW